MSDADTRLGALEIAARGLMVSLKKERDRIPGSEQPHLLEGDAATEWTGLNSCQAMARRIADKIAAVRLLEQRQAVIADEIAELEISAGFTQAVDDPPFGTEEDPYA